MMKEKISEKTINYVEDIFPGQGGWMYLVLFLINIMVICQVDLHQLPACDNPKQFLLKCDMKIVNKAHLDKFPPWHINIIHELSHGII